MLGEDAEQLKSAVKRVPMLELMVCVHEPVPEVMVAVAIEMSVALSGSVTDALIVNEWPIDAFVIELIVAFVGGEFLDMSGETVFESQLLYRTRQNLPEPVRGELMEA